MTRFLEQGSVNDRFRRGRNRSVRKSENLSIQPPVSRAVMENSLEIARHCETENGGYLRDIIFHN